MGSPPKKGLKDVEAMRFVIYDFGDRTEKRDQSIETPTLQAHGYSWKLRVYPRGCRKSPSDIEYMSCYLHSVGDKKHKVDLFYSIRCKEFGQELPKARKFSNAYCGFRKYLARKNVLSKYLEED